MGPSAFEDNAVHSAEDHNLNDSMDYRFKICFDYVFCQCKWWDDKSSVGFLSILVYLYTDKQTVSHSNVSNLRVWGKLIHCLWRVISMLWSPKCPVQISLILYCLFLFHSICHLWRNFLVPSACASTPARHNYDMIVTNICGYNLGRFQSALQQLQC